MTITANLTERLRKWQGSCPNPLVCRAEALAAIVADCATAADRIDELEAALTSTHELLDAVYRYHYAQDPSLRNNSEREILATLDSVNNQCEAAIRNAKANPSH